MSLGRKTALLLFLALLSIFFTACEQKAGDNDSLRIGYAIEKPYAYINDDGKLTGQSIETARVLAQKIGYENITWVQMDFSSLLSRLMNQRIDVIAAGMFIHPERESKIDFSIPFLKVTSAFLVARKNAEKLRQFEINTEVVRVIVLAGSVELERLQLLGSSNLHIIKVPDLVSAKAALASDLGDALFLSVPTLDAALADFSNKYEIVSSRAVLGSEIIEYVGFGFHPEQETLKKRWNQAAKPWLTSSEHLKLITKFGFSADNLVQDSSS